MPMRVDYGKVAPQAMTALGGVHKYLNDASIDRRLRALVEMRVSQINGCAYCMDLHSNEAREVGESQQRLDVLGAWRETEFFSEREKAALAWAEAVTKQGHEHIPDDLLAETLKHFSEKEIVDLTVIIAMMNAWNRIAVPLRKTIAKR
ncbi:MAG: carboxymuconolactone decarboxylase family protein [Phycisphaerae bacterium]|nr:carboxymuconolactone decarboxylase family protein [Phycisphaerae bacterium]